MPTFEEAFGVPGGHSLRLVRTALRGSMSGSGSTRSTTHAARSSPFMKAGRAATPCPPGAGAAAGS